jgi:hypothetical protein
MEKRNTLPEWICWSVMRTCLLVLAAMAFIGCVQFQHKLPEKKALFSQT